MVPSPQPMQSVPVDMALDHAEKWLMARPALARAQASEVLRALPTHPRAQLIVARALYQEGDLGRAHSMLLSLAAAQPRSAATALALGQVLAALGRTADACAHLRRATILKPDFPAAWSALSAALRENGDEKGADEADLAGIRASTSDPVLVDAALALGAGKLDIAEPILRARLKTDPTDVAATRMLGELAWRLGRIDDALTLLQRTLDLAPGFDAARELLCRILSRTHRVAEALTQSEILLSRHPASATHAMLKASLMVRVGDQEGARDLYRALLATHGQHPKIWLNLGHVLKTLGEQRDAIDAYRRAIALCPSLGEAYWSLANLKTVSLTTEDMVAMERALDTGCDTDDALHLHFALGKAYEDAANHQKAFAHYATANNLRRQELPHDADEIERRAHEHATVFSREFISALPNGGCSAPDPIFIVGMPRAGSTLVEQILASHSEIEGTMELPDMMMIASRLDARVEQGEFESFHDLVHSLSPKDRQRLGEEYIDRTRMHRKTTKPRFIDKMPNNWLHVGLIRMILPNAKIIDARRHPVGCCFSGWKQHFARGQAFSYDLVDIGRYYCDYVRTMASFDAADPGSIHRVIYENMVSDTQAQISALLEYVGVPFEDGCMTFHETRRAVRTASSEQVRRPIFTDAVDHWRHYEAWLEPLIAALGQLPATYPDARA